jgi:hypothetical protein
MIVHAQKSDARCIEQMTVLGKGRKAAVPLAAGCLRQQQLSSFLGPPQQPQQSCVWPWSRRLQASCGFATGLQSATSNIICLLDRQSEAASPVCLSDSQPVSA